MRYKTHIVSTLALGAGLSILTNYPFHIGYVVGLQNTVEDIGETEILLVLNIATKIFSTYEKGKSQ